MSAAIIAFPRARSAGASAPACLHPVKPLQPFAVAKGLRGDERITRLFNALQASRAAFDASDAANDATLSNRCCMGWFRAIRAIAATPAGIEGVRVKLELLETVLADGESEHPWWLINSIRRDLRRLPVMP